jgi:hypothetical protein
MLVRPFRGSIVAPALAAETVTPAVEVLDAAQRAELAERRPMSYLHVIAGETGDGAPARRAGGRAGGPPRPAAPRGRARAAERGSASTCQVSSRNRLEITRSAKVAITMVPITTITPAAAASPTSNARNVRW